MKLFLILMMSVSAGVASADHFHSFLLGVSIATLAVASCYWCAFQRVQFPQLALAMLILGLFAKFFVAAAGVLFGVSQGLITSPLVFVMSYLYFSIVATYLWYRYRNRRIKNPFSVKRTLSGSAN
ncbi:NADH:ubiquinone oxidoreductase [Vibrio scophthalmi]|uniref:NADH:ubiquinone oxidoreductase n=1 Tax=Vibrio scophthalmi TaxID=45658 RepID=UPI002FEE6C4B